MKERLWRRVLFSQVLFLHGNAVIAISLSIACKILFKNLFDFYFAQSPMDICETRVSVVSKPYILQLKYAIKSAQAMLNNANMYLFPILFC